MFSLRMVFFSDIFSSLDVTETNAYKIEKKNSGKVFKVVTTKKMKAILVQDKTS